MNGQYEGEEMLAVIWNCYEAANQNVSHLIPTRMVMTDRQVLVIKRLVWVRLWGNESLHIAGRKMYNDVAIWGSKLVGSFLKLLNVSHHMI